MTMLVILFDNTMGKDGIHQTSYCKLMSDLKSNKNDKKCYQEVDLK